MTDSIQLHHGDSREVLKTLADASIDACVCDPPYALVSIGKRFGKEGAAPAAGGVYARASAGFMGQKWDTGETAFDPAFWREVLRVLKPGAHVVAFGGTRSYHRLVVGIEDAGFEIRDTICWHFGSGFPKSLSVSKSARATVCRCAAGNDLLRGLREDADTSGGVGEAGQDADVFSSVQRGIAGQGLGDARAQGISGPHTGELRQGSDEGSEEPSLEGRRDAPAAARKLCERPLCEVPTGPDLDGPEGRLRDGAPSRDGAMDWAPPDPQRDGSPQGPSASEQPALEPGALARQSEPQTGRAWPLCGGCGKPIVPTGLGTALKPATELICVARKPLEGTVAANVLAYGTGALNIDACRVDAPEGVPIFSSRGESRSVALGDGLNGSNRTGEQGTGRWPANVVHDGSDEVLAAFPDAPGQQQDIDPSAPSPKTSGIYGKMNREGEASADRRYTDRGSTDFAPLPGQRRGDSGSAARFFYTAKADAEDRLGSKHPTVKPVSLMRWLCRLVTPPGGVVLDPFAGSGTTGLAALAEGFGAVLIEREAKYFADIERRLKWARGEGRLTAQESARHPAKTHEDLELFKGEAA